MDRKTALIWITWLCAHETKAPFNFLLPPFKVIKNGFMLGNNEKDGKLLMRKERREKEK
jgi:hypothetical protein